MSTVFADNILPSVTGYDAGSPTQRWDVYAQNLDVSGTVIFHNLLSPNATIASLASTGGAGTLASPWTGWEAAINLLPVNSHIHFPAGHYAQAVRIDMKTGWTITGDGPANVTITSSFAGSAFKTISAINSSTNINIDISGIGITNTNATPTGACIENVGGTGFYVHNVWLTGCKYSLILDQAEIVSVYDNYFWAPVGANSGNIWLTNGADWTAGALPGFTNRISILRNQFNNTAGVGIQVIDDGGGSHTISGNNFNAGVMAVRAANVTGLVLSGNEAESHTEAPYQWFATTLSGNYVGLSSGLVAHGNVTNASSGNSDFRLDFITGGVISGNWGSATAGTGLFTFKNGASNQATGLTIVGNSKLIIGTSKTSGGFVDGFGVALLRNNIWQETQTYAASGHAGGAQTVTPAFMGAPGYTDAISVGQKLFVMNADGTNSEDVTVTAIGATTFNAVFASTKAANWLIYGIYGPSYNATVFNATTGFRVAGAAASGKVLRGDGTNFVSASLAAADLSNGVTGTGAVVLAGGNPAFTAGMTLGGLITTYNGVALTGNGIPSIVAKANLTAQGAAISTTTIYAVPTSGFYAIRWVASITRAGSVSSTLGGATGFQVVYTDINDSVVKTSTPASVTGMTSTTNTTATTVSGAVHAYAKTGTNLQYAFGYTDGGGTTMQYDLNLIVESLG
jgi:hypothetical protein